MIPVIMVWELMTLRSRSKIDGYPSLMVCLFRFLLHFFGRTGCDPQGKLLSLYHLCTITCVFDQCHQWPCPFTSPIYSPIARFDILTVESELLLPAQICSFDFDSARIAEQSCLLHPEYHHDHSHCVPETLRTMSLPMLTYATLHQSPEL